MTEEDGVVIRGRRWRTTPWHKLGGLRPPEGRALRAGARRRGRVLLRVSRRLPGGGPPRRGVSGMAHSLSFSSSFSLSLSLSFCVSAHWCTC